MRYDEDGGFTIRGFDRTKLQDSAMKLHLEPGRYISYVLL